MQFVSNHNVTVRSKSGHVIRFERNVPRDVPQALRREVMAIGIVPAESSPDLVENIENEVNRVVPLPEALRNALVFHALNVIREENDTSKFDAAGRPKVDAVNALFHGFLSINATTRNAAWDELRALIAEGEEAPSHKDLETFLALAEITSRDEIADYGKMLGVEESALEALSVRDARRLLINKLLTG